MGDDGNGVCKAYQNGPSEGERGCILIFIEGNNLLHESDVKGLQEFSRVQVGE